MPPNNPDLNPADYSIFENLSQNCINIKGLGICKTRRIYWKKYEQLPQYEIDAYMYINQFRYRLLKVIDVAGKHILNIFSRTTVLSKMCDCCLSLHVGIVKS